MARNRKRSKRARATGDLIQRVYAEENWRPAILVDRMKETGIRFGDVGLEKRVDDWSAGDSAPRSAFDRLALQLALRAHEYPEHIYTDLEIGKVVPSYESWFTKYAPIAERCNEWRSIFPDDNSHRRKLESERQLLLDDFRQTPDAELGFSDAEATKFEPIQLGRFIRLVEAIERHENQKPANQRLWVSTHLHRISHEIGLADKIVEDLIELSFSMVENPETIDKIIMQALKLRPIRIAATRENIQTQIAHMRLDNPRTQARAILDSVQFKPQKYSEKGDRTLRPLIEELCALCHAPFPISIFASLTLASFTAPGWVRDDRVHLTEAEVDNLLSLLKKNPDPVTLNIGLNLIGKFFYQQSNDEWKHQDLMYQFASVCDGMLSRDTIELHKLTWLEEGREKNWCFEDVMDVFNHHPEGDAKILAALSMCRMGYWHNAFYDPLFSLIYHPDRSIYLIDEALIYCLMNEKKRLLEDIYHIMLTRSDHPPLLFQHFTLILCGVGERWRLISLYRFYRDTPLVVQAVTNTICAGPAIFKWFPLIRFLPWWLSPTTRQISGRIALR